MELIIVKTTVKGLVLDAGEENVNIVIPEGIRVIGVEAFKNKPIASVTFPSSLIKICEGAFSKTNITEAEIPDSVTYIGRCAFFLCSSLKTVKLPKGLTTLEQDVFFGCNNLEHLDFPPALLEIKAGALIDTTKLKSVDLSRTNIHTIGILAFFQSAIEEIKLPETLKTLGESAFQRCTKLTKIEIPCSVEVLPGKLFNECSNLTELKLHEGLKQIEWLALPHNLTDVEFPESLEWYSYDCMCFEQFSQLKLPPKTVIGYLYRNAFISAYSPPIYPKNPKIIEENGCFLSDDRKILLAVPNIPAVNLPNGPDQIRLCFYGNTIIRELNVCESAEFIYLTFSGWSDNSTVLDKLIIQGKPRHINSGNLSVNKVVFPPEMTEKSASCMMNGYFNCSGKLNKIYSNAPQLFLRKYSPERELALNAAYLSAYFEGGYPYTSDIRDYIKQWVSLAQPSVLFGLGIEIFRNLIKSDMLSSKKAKLILPFAEDLEIRRELIDYLSENNDDLSL